MFPKEFCAWCGTRLARMYPGGDPENGPARKTCPVMGCYGNDREHSDTEGPECTIEAHLEMLTLEASQPIGPNTDTVGPMVHASAAALLAVLKAWETASSADNDLAEKAMLANHAHILSARK